MTTEERKSRKGSLKYPVTDIVKYLVFITVIFFD